MKEFIEEEVWKDIEGYENLYQVSNLGKIKTFHLKHYGKLLKQTDVKGYKVVRLYKGGRFDDFLVHRLVALSFVPNPDNLPVVNHKDENPSNNKSDNLEWCTQYYNCHYGTAQERRAKACYKKVLKFDLEGNFISSYNSVKEAGACNDITPHGISGVLDKNLSVGGYIWRRQSNRGILTKIEKPIIKNKAKTVLQYTLQGEFVAEYKSIHDAAKQNKDTPISISLCCRGKYKFSKEFVYKYK